MWSLLNCRAALGGLPALLRFSEELGLARTSEHALKSGACGILDRAGFGTAVPTGYALPQEQRVVPGHRCFASVGENISSPREKRLQVSG